MLAGQVAMPAQRLRRHHRAEQDADQHEADARERQRHLHRTADQRSHRHRQHRAGDQPGGKADHREDDPAGRRDQQRLGGLEEFARRGKGSGIDRSRTDQCRVRFAASNDRAAEHVHGKAGAQLRNKRSCVSWSRSRTCSSAARRRSRSLRERRLTATLLVAGIPAAMSSICWARMRSRKTACASASPARSWAPPRPSAKRPAKRAGRRALDHVMADGEHARERDDSEQSGLLEVDAALDGLECRRTA